MNTDKKVTTELVDTPEGYYEKHIKSKPRDCIPRCITCNKKYPQSDLTQLA